MTSVTQLENVEGGLPRELASQFLRYCAVGGISFCLDAGVLAFLVHAGVFYLVAAASGFVAGAVLNYLLSAHLVFKGRRFQDRKVEFLWFFGIGLVTLGCNEVLMFLQVSLLHASPITAKAVTAILILGLNFWLRKLLVFPDADER